MRKTFTFENDDGEEIEVDLSPFMRKAVCDGCHGEGTHVNRSIDGHGISAEEWERDWDPDEREDYFAGAYDVTCEDCHGLRVVDVLDEEAFEKAEPECYERWCEDRRSAREMAATYAAERRMGA